MKSVEIDFVVPDSAAALALYDHIFEIERIHITDLPKGQNEAVFTLYGTRFHILDENPEFQLTAPRPNDPKPVWFNMVVPDIRTTYDKAITAGCTEIQPITEIPETGGANALFADKFGYVWMLHEMKYEVSFDERVRILEEKNEKKKEGEHGK